MYLNGDLNDGIGCLLSDGDTCVEDGYSGNDAGDTHCNTCICSSGSLICTLMACQDETSSCDDENGECLLSDGETCVEDGYNGPDGDRIL